MKYLMGLTTLGVMAAAAAASAAPPGNAANGAVIFKKCASCHSIDPGKNGLGPTLRGVVGRKAGTVTGFNYSPAMKASGQIWNDKNLARFLAAPRQAVPGTKMIFVGLPKPQDQADVIAYLKQNSAKK